MHRDDNILLVGEVLRFVDMEQREVEEDEAAGKIESSDDAGFLLEGY